MIGIDLQGRSAVVTGASAGIGRACALTLARAGARVLVVARRERELAEVVSQGNGRIDAVAVDLADPSAAAVVAHAAQRTLGGVDLLVNAAGGSRTVAVDAPDAQWEDAMQLNFGSARRLTSALLPRIVAAGPAGRIVTVTGSSEPASNPVYADPASRSALNAANSAKAAVHAWSKGLSREVGRFGVTVNCVAPGSILSEQLLRIFPTEADQARHVAEVELPFGRFGTPDEVADAVLFLASPLARYVSGEILHVDGSKRRYAF